ncbi:DUF4340 domain-containing protein [Saccharospirillum salsuginis]|uniref:DUF4340 domain-containing protein n=1 Tax=Saccharospirillum salsuginis TaxID=418750 RepID=A0A918NJZ1_9GAMM|nr:DUF4340 domain-containing protein [Saccharospirillum salsuginis]GGX73304.1 hypothetical protein GCM10007392_45900 [Saccharospirillum salsuginis]
MFNRFNQGLLVAFVLQLLLVAVVQGNVLWNDDGIDTEPLLAFEREQVTEVRIDDHSGDTERSLTLVRQDDRWWLERNGQRYPASSATVDTVLGPLAEAQLTWPVADSGTAAERFETADDNYQRRLALVTDGGDKQHLYFGTSPGYRQVHVRRGDQADVHSIQLNAVDLNAKADAWLDRGLLQVDLEPVTEVALGERSVQRREDGWRLADDADANLDQGAWKDWLRKWSTLTVSGWVDEELETQLADAEPALTVEFGGAEPMQVALYHQDGTYAIQRSDVPGYFRVANGVAQGLVDVDGLWVAVGKDEASITE